MKEEFKRKLQKYWIGIFETINEEERDLEEAYCLFMKVSERFITVKRSESSEWDKVKGGE